MLTPRQSEIAALVAKGLSNKAIARETGLAIQTVKNHIDGAATRLPGDGRPRHRILVWFFSLSDEDKAA